jgi:hypothetical protein
VIELAVVVAETVGEEQGVKQETVADQPVAVDEPSDLNQMVKDPSAAVEVTVPGAGRDEQPV